MVYPVIWNDNMGPTSIDITLCQFFVFRFMLYQTFDICIPQWIWWLLPVNIYWFHNVESTCYNVRVRDRYGPANSLISKLSFSTLYEITIFSIVDSDDLCIQTYYIKCISGFYLSIWEALNQTRSQQNKYFWYPYTCLM